LGDFCSWTTCHRRQQPWGMSVLLFQNLTLSMHQSHIHDAAQVGQSHSNLHIPQCKTQMQIS
jgi:hypothetical protein